MPGESDSDEDVPSLADSADSDRMRHLDIPHGAPEDHAQRGEDDDSEWETDTGSAPDDDHVASSIAHDPMSQLQVERSSSGHISNGDGSDSSAVHHAGSRSDNPLLAVAGLAMRTVGWALRSAGWVLGVLAGNHR